MVKWTNTCKNLLSFNYFFVLFILETMVTIFFARIAESITGFFPDILEIKFLHSKNKGDLVDLKNI